MAIYRCSSPPREAIAGGPSGMEHRSHPKGDLENSAAPDGAFDQLLRLAASYLSRKTTGAQTSVAANLRRGPLSEDIELRAYQLYLSRGASHGHDVDDWLEAERQILAGLKSDKATLRVALAFGLLNSER
jgi:hypothetical protein